MSQNRIAKIYVTSIIDGDSFKCISDDFDGEIEVRLSNIDAPELNQPAGWESKFELRELLINNDNELYLNPRFLRNNKYIGDVYIKNPLEYEVSLKDTINFKMVENGQAWFLDGAANNSESLNKEYKAIEKTARLKENGLWNRMKTPVLPYVWHTEKMEMGLIERFKEFLKKDAYLKEKNIRIGLGNEDSLFSFTPLTNKMKIKGDKDLIEFDFEDEFMNEIVSDMKVKQQNRQQKIPTKEILEKEDEIKAEIDEQKLKNFLEDANKKYTVKQEWLEKKQEEQKNKEALNALNKLQEKDNLENANMDMQIPSNINAFEENNFMDNFAQDMNVPVNNDFDSNSFPPMDDFYPNSFPPMDDFDPNSYPPMDDFDPNSYPSMDDFDPNSFPPMDDFDPNSLPPMENFNHNEYIPTDEFTQDMNQQTNNMNKKESNKNNNEKKKNNWKGLTRRP